ncbi:putative ribonuclease H-like domain-containing protein [Tanacetum coccineum]|uniref:Ribonuclease H-like domain-containing protein n=1 Tax=Tanacetum coccineum TaxID=301880 RepID=A0ABQ5G987_9ASTR
MRLRWSLTGKMFDIKGNLIASSESNGDNACTPNPQEPTIKRFQNSTFSLGRNRTTKLYTINLHDMAYASPICLMAWATSTKSWLWHQRLSHLNFDTINDLHLELILHWQRLHLLHYGFVWVHMRIAIKHNMSSGMLWASARDDYYDTLGISQIQKAKHQRRFKHFSRKITVSLQALVIIVRNENGSEFKKQVLPEYFNRVGISHQASSVRTPQQNGAEAIATGAHSNRSFIHRRFDKTPYEFINGRKPDISFLHVFGALCYPKNDHEDIGKLDAKGDICFFIGYSANSCSYRVYNRSTKKIMETINGTFDELSAMAFEQNSLKPRLQSMTSGQISSRLDLPYALSTITTQTPTEGELDLLFKAMYDDHVGGQLSTAPRTIPATKAPQVLQTPTATTTTPNTAPTPTNSSSQATSIPRTSHNVNKLETQHQHVQHQLAIVADNVPNAMFDNNTFVNPFVTPSTSVAESSSSQYVDPSNMHTFYQPYPHEYQYTKDHPLEQVI